MYSWKLFQRIKRDILNSPIYWHEVGYAPVWQGAAARVARSATMRYVLAGTVGLTLILGTMTVNSPVFACLVPLVVLLVVTGLTLGPTIARERAHQTWILLQIMPSGVESVLLDKLVGALSWIQGLLVFMGMLLVVGALGTGLLSLLLLPTGRGLTPDLPDTVLCGWLLILPTATAALFVVDRVQQYMLAVIVALATSATTRSITAGLFWTTLAVVGTWVLEAAITVVVLLAQPGGTDLANRTLLLVIATFGPLPSYMLGIDSAGRVVLLIAATLIVRDLLIGFMWRLAVRRAQ
ncbi:hypothetical protein [Aggregatilinea lenta]|uniref:hypothetical protein n=1 Tax=Aggregatilinea lenta TaxID=913108 RepID=UPI000E5B41B2|nr:hypothetical protein [Aggregatilinea lenta]